MGEQNAAHTSCRYRLREGLWRNLDLPAVLRRGLKLWETEQRERSLTPGFPTSYPFELSARHMFTHTLVCAASEPRSNIMLIMPERLLGD